MRINKAQTLFSPPTPHRIELCSDSDETANAEDSEKLPQPKAKKRFEKCIFLHLCLFFNLRSSRTNSEQNGEVKANGGSHKLTEYFPVRRSVRKTKKTVLEEQQRSLENLLRLEIEEGLSVSV